MFFVIDYDSNSSVPIAPIQSVPKPFKLQKGVTTICDIAQCALSAYL